ncbi:MAG TPA: DegT/DnrJ/EryC1/StrS aminotransferase family protein [Polyangia bacterium]|nr:DegT/DnrJ/EryC1/StrS aminotransferase family protein [Polyangia bacterium]
MSDPNYIVFGKPFIGEEEIAEVVDTLRSGWLGTGPKTTRFEEAFRSYIGAGHAASLGSCTSALFLSQLTLGIGPGDAVITTPMTFVATANSVRHTGARPLFADVHPDSGLMDPAAVERLLVEDCQIASGGAVVHRSTGARVRAILPVHLWGLAADLKRLRGLADRFGLYLIADAAHAVETAIDGTNVGTLADVTCYSFYSTKNLCTAEGGMITTERDEFVERIRILRQHGQNRDAWKRFSSSGYRHYLATEVGWKFNMTDMQAALGIHQLARIERMHAIREQQWHRYDEMLPRTAGFQRPPAPAPGTRHAFHLYAVRIQPESGWDRDHLMDSLHGLGIGSGVHYLSVSEHPAYDGFMNVPVPNAVRIGRETMSLPLGGALTADQQSHVIETVTRLLGAPPRRS